MNVFDIVGPIMIGPSSSHTAGAARLGCVAAALLGRPAVRAQVLLHGSFAKTYLGHGTDKALIAGILGMRPDDERIRRSPALAREAGLAVELVPGVLEDAQHPNTALIHLWDDQGNQVSVQGASVGGGNVLISRVNGLAVEITGQAATLIVLHRDAPGTIAEVTRYIAETGANICNFRLSRTQKGGTAVMTIEIDGNAGPGLDKRIRLFPNILSCTLLQPI